MIYRQNIQEVLIIIKQMEMELNYLHYKLRSNTFRCEVFLDGRGEA
jgi:hypothetical protein